MLFWFLDIPHFFLLDYCRAHTTKPFAVEDFFPTLLADAHRKIFSLLFKVIVPQLAVLHSYQRLNIVNYYKVCLKYWTNRIPYQAYTGWGECAWHKKDVGILDFINP